MSSEFYTLNPVKKGIGEHTLIRQKKDKHPEKDWRFRFSQNDDDEMLTLDFPAKSWQHKAWDEIHTLVPIDMKAPFIKNKDLPKRLRHMVQVSVMMKALVVDKKTRVKGIVGCMDASIGHNRYITGNTAATIKNVFNRMYEMLFTDIESYRKHCRSGQEGMFIFKCLVIYDDNTVDTFTGNPLKMFTALKLEFDKKGRVKL